MFITSDVAQQNDINKQSSHQQSTLNTYTLPPNPGNCEDRRREEMTLHLHMKNRKKYTHLYELEKHFR